MFKTKKLKKKYLHKKGSNIGADCTRERQNAPWPEPRS